VIEMWLETVFWVLLIIFALLLILAVILSIYGQVTFERAKRRFLENLCELNKNLQERKVIATQTKVWKGKKEPKKRGRPKRK